MSLRSEIETKLQSVLKKRNKLQVSTLRLILAAIKDRDIASRTIDNKEGIKDTDIKQLLIKMIKQILFIFNITEITSFVNPYNPIK